MTGDRSPSRRTVLKATGAAVVGGVTATGSAIANNHGVHGWDARNVNAAPYPDTGGELGVRNNNGTASRIRISSTGGLDGTVLTVGANQERIVHGDPGEVIQNVEAKRPQDAEFQDSATGCCHTLS